MTGKALYARTLKALPVTGEMKKIFLITFVAFFSFGLGITLNYVLFAFSEPGTNPPSAIISGMFAPVFYDSNNSSFYINPEGSSNLQNLTVNGSHNIQDADNYVSNAGYASSAGSAGSLNGNFNVSNAIGQCVIRCGAGGGYYWYNGITFPLNWGGGSCRNFLSKIPECEQNYCVWRVVNPDGSFSAANC